MTRSPAQTQQLYDRDYALWLQTTVSQLHTGDLTQLDRANLIEELEDMGRRERQSLASNLVVVLLHLLKWEFQPDMRTGSWSGSIAEHRRRINKSLKASPSLKNHFADILDECYDDARFQASAETGLPIESFQPECPYSIDAIRDRQFLPDARS
ncbi:MAG: DUF29 domain-containing protein [Geitlerinemataceae cyanobacterium]